MRLRLSGFICCVFFITPLFALCVPDVPEKHRDQSHHWDPVIAILGSTCRQFSSKRGCLMLFYQNGTRICDWRSKSTSTQSIPCNLNIQKAKQQFPNDFSMSWSQHARQCASLKTQTSCDKYMNKQDKQLRCKWQK